ncbi:T9SS type A sorting domain-containing protein [candidate division KSB1 bacterium]|nr:T9SS type A sorting domain-containing protein [candidate division KSB1 bacterium]
MQKIIFIFLLILLFQLPHLFAQPAFITALYPPQHGLNIPADAEIHIGLQKALDTGSICDSSIYIYSDITGLHKWEYRLENGGKALYLQPKHWWGVGDVPFNAGERVTVTLTTCLRYADGQQFEGFTWHYTVAVRQNYGGNFTPIATFGAIQLQPYYIADFNGDRAPDLAAHDSFQKQVALFLNDGRGKFEFAYMIPGWGAGGGTQTVDYDRNGGIDIPIGYRIIKFNDGKAQFTSEEILPEWVEGYRLYDFNNDGIFDVVANVPNQKHGIKVALSKSGEAFIDSQTISVPFQPKYNFPIELYDLDNDGKRDIIAPGKSLPDRSFRGFATIKMKNTTPLELFQIENNDIFSFVTYANDLNNDGFIDYAFIGGYIDPSQPYFMTNMNDGTGLLMPKGVHVDTNKAYQSGTGGDIDGDGDIDFFMMSSILYSAMPELVANKYTFAINQSDGIFDLLTERALPFDSTNSGYGNQTHLVDLDLDGDLDIMLRGGGQFMVIANETYVTDINDFDLPLPVKSALKISNYPNPFNQHTRISISGTPIHKNVSLKIFNLMGHLVRSWDISILSTGPVQLNWDGTDEHYKKLSSGIYFVQAKTDLEIVTKKILFLQ